MKPDILRLKKTFDSGLDPNSKVKEWNEEDFKAHFNYYPVIIVERIFSIFYTQLESRFMNFKDLIVCYSVLKSEVVEE